MDLRTHYPFSLLRYGLIQSFPSLYRNVRTEVAVIGAGISGALIAWHLQKAGIPCLVVDKRHVATGSTAASTSLIQYEIDQPLHRLIPLIGYKKAVQSYALCRQAVADLRQLCLDIGHSEAYQEKGSLQFASSRKDLEGLKKEYFLRKKHGFRVDLLAQADVCEQFRFTAPAALYTYEAAQLDAYRFTHQLLTDIQHTQGSVYDHTEVISVNHEKRKKVLTTAEGYTISAKKLVIACGYESGAYLGKKLEDLRCTYAIISEPLPHEELWKNNCLIWETADPYLYMRATDDRRVLIGGKDTAYMNIRKQLEVMPGKARSLQRSFQKIFPHLPLKIDFQWAGAFASTSDGLPYIGCIPELKHTYFALGYGGNGITFSLIAAQMISRVISGGKHPGMSIFSFDRG